MRDEWRDRQIAELTTEQFNIITHDILYALDALRMLEVNVSALRAVLSENFKNRLRMEYNTDNVDGINTSNIKLFREKIETNLICLEPALNSVKQIERLPSVAEIVRMIENGKEVKL